MTQPEAQLTFLFFLPDQRGVAFATLDTDGHGIASAIFDSHGEFDVVVTTKDASQASLPVNLKLSLVAKGP